MYICSDCRQPIGPRISPVLMVTQTRSVTYTNPVPDSYEVRTTHGTEIVKEVKLCRPCAQMEPVNPPETYNVEAAIGAAKGREDHARRCKKPFDDCKLCQDNLRWFNSLPLTTLARVLADRSPKKGH